MLKHRIIPILLFNEKLQVVQTTQFKRPYRPVGSLRQHIKVMESRNIDEIILLDIEATSQRREPNFEAIKEFASELFCPVSYGGGISNIDHIGRLIQDCGVDKVAVKTNTKVMEDTANKYGSQAVVGVIDFDENEAEDGDGNPSRFVGICSINLYVKYLIKQGCGEILLTSINKNGTLKGYDLLLIQDICKEISIPVIANGGCYDWLCMKHAIEVGASAVAASTMFLHTDTTPRDCARALHEAGVPVRLDPHG